MAGSGLSIYGIPHASDRLKINNRFTGAWMKICACVLLASFSLALIHGDAAPAQEQPHPGFVIAEMATIHSKVLGEDRTIFVYDPDKNGSNLLPSYPVLYLLDENDMTMVTGLVKYLSAYNENMTPMLVIGIDGGPTRIRDLTPTHALVDNLGVVDSDPDSWLKDSGGGERFSQFIRDEVMPYVEQHYKAAPFRIFAGHSVGGLEVVDTLLQHPEMFNAYFAISPSFWWDRGYPVSLAKEKLPALAAKGRFLFLADSPETGPFTRYVRSFDTLMATSKPVSLQYKHAFYPTESHGSIAAKAYYDGMRYLYPAWDKLDSDNSAALIKQHYKATADRLGYDVEPPLGMVSDWGFGFLRQPAKAADAFEMFQMNIKNFPNSPSVYQDLGDAYSQKGRTQEAVSAYKKALDLAPNDQQIAQRLKSLQQKQ
jgi:predicted alpha/beta superfamily hydrolase